MKKIYCISGLGADEKAFAKLHVQGYQLVHLPWLIPVKDETIDEYAERMSRNITDHNPVIMGLSFGGIMGIEIAKKLAAVDKVILISSVKSYKEIPAWMKLAGKLKLNKIVPVKSYDILEPVQNHFIGATTQKEKEMVRTYRKNVSPEYLSWAVDKVLNWKNDWQPYPIYHIHGDADNIFPIKRIKADYVVKNAGHFMIMNKAGEVNKFLEKILIA